MQLTAIHHVAIIVSDYEVSRDFYVNKLGFAVVRENWRPHKQDWKLDLRIDETTELEIFAPKDPHARPSYPEACGLRHLAFAVDDIEQVVAELEERGIACEPIRYDEFTHRKMTFFHDPDNLPLELHE
ncbi:MAG: VOC family protein [Atopobiaceae bacterium]|nr:VOC family protein [Atopobiaceae bacterium]